MPEKSKEGVKKMVGVCPVCGSDNLYEVNRVTVMYEITEWDPDSLEPFDYGDSDFLGDTACVVDENKYHCYGCNAEFDDPAFVEVNAEDESETD